MDATSFTNEEKKKIIIPKYTKRALIISAVLLSFYVLVKVLKKFDIYLYLFGVGSDAITQIVIYVCGIILISTLVVLLYENSKHKMIVAIILAVGITLLSLFFSFVFAFTYHGSDWYNEFTSPDKKHTIVMYDTGDLLDGSLVFEKTSFFTMRCIRCKGTDNGTYSFGRYDELDIIWNEDNFELHFENGTNDDAITIDYIK